MSSVAPEELVAAYQRGALTGHELVIRLIQLAVNHPPEEILPIVPEELLPQLRERGNNPPARPDALRFWCSVCSSASFDYEAWQRQEQATYYDGAWRWHRFLTKTS